MPLKAVFLRIQFSPLHDYVGLSGLPQGRPVRLSGRPTHSVRHHAGLMVPVITLQTRTIMNQSIQTYQFNQIPVSVIDHNGDGWMTGDDVGKSLEYNQPRKRINEIFSRYRDELEEFSVDLKLRSTDGKLYNMRVYNEEGVMMLAFFSKQPKAAAFRKWAVSVLKSYRQQGSRPAIPTETQTIIRNLQAELLNSRKRMDKVLRLQQAGFSKAESARMLAIGETTVRKEAAILKRCGFRVDAAGGQLDLFGGAL